MNKYKKGALKGFKPTKPKNKVVVYSSSEESDISFPLNDTTDESSDGSVFGLVEKVDDADISAKFLRQSCKRSVDGKPIFTFKDNDEGVIPRGDVLKKLPTPKKLGGTARREEKFIFPCSIDKWNVE